MPAILEDYNENGELDSIGRSDEQYRWSNGELPYKFSNYDGFNKYMKIEIESHIAHFNAKFLGCIKIRPKTNMDWNYVNIIDGDGCTSHVGRQFGRQVLSLSCYGCINR